MGSWERGFNAWKTALAFDRFEQGRLFAADVGSRAPAKLDVEVETHPAEDVPAEIARFTGLLDGVLQPGVTQRVLAAQKDPAVLDSHGVSGQRHGFDQTERVLFHRDPVLERAGFALIRVGDDMLAGWVAGRGAGHLPLGAQREHRPAAAGNAAILGGGNERLGYQGQRLAQSRIAAVLLEVFQAGRVNFPGPGQHDQWVAVHLWFRSRVATLQKGVDTGRCQIAGRAVAVQGAGSVLAHAQAGHKLIGDPAVIARLARLKAQARLDRLAYFAATGHLAGRIPANSDDALCRRFVIEHRVELDHAVYVGQRHAQGLPGGLQYFAGQPAHDGLRFVQEGKQGIATTSSIPGQYRFQRDQIER